MSGPQQTMYVQTQQLYNAAYSWDSVVKPDIATAQTDAVDGEGQGYVFGAVMAFLGTEHDTFVKAAADLLAVGKTSAEGIGTSIRAAAQHYEQNDTERATLFTKLQLQKGDI